MTGGTKDPGATRGSLQWDTGGASVVCLSCFFSYSTFLCAYVLFIHKTLKLGKTNRLASAIRGNTIVFLTVT